MSPERENLRDQRTLEKGLKESYQTVIVIEDKREDLNNLYSKYLTKL